MQQSQKPLFVLQEVRIELKLSSLDLLTDPNVVFYYGDEVSRLKYRRSVGCCSSCLISAYIVVAQLCLNGASFGSICYTCIGMAK